MFLFTTSEYTPDASNGPNPEETTILFEQPTEISQGQKIAAIVIMSICGK